MSAAETKTVPEPSGASATLGDVLYANRAERPTPEAEWVAVVRSVATGDQRALHELYDRAHRLVFTLALRITCNKNTAEEVTLDVFHDVWRRAAAYDPANGSVLGWIMNQARSRAVDRWRFEMRVKRVNPQPQVEDVVTDDRCPDAVLQLAQQQGALRNALLVLTAGERQAIETAYFSGLTHAETARRLNLPLGTVKTRIRSGLSKLRKALPQDFEQ